ncbi:MAG: efflux transporter periplasmic adaptor subunit [Ignavibacteria bacterium CG22_combo_CG10-13_8_21_14_all_37_15]|nr:MAG: efflux transporter periplasmic adaptor subunit [Ignavibacteria bacterium CG22_combo_CG10-13_8_21_14_all_37_15]
MKKKTLIIPILIIGIALIAYFLFFKDDEKTTRFTFAEVTKGDLNVIISSSGTIQAIKTVDVGTQVSGKIDRLLVDFNSQVRKGQLLAVLDTVVLAASVRDAQSSLDRANAQYDQAVAVHERNKQLFEKSFMNEVDFIASKTNVQVLLANLKSALTAYERAKLNLGYAYLYSPISGTIINRSVEQGQTVAASLSAPTIFTIAEDLSSMRILTNVDESDIGQIKEGQKVQFTVQAFSDKKFDGEVTQIRLNPNVVSNVVNYVVVVNAENANKLLLPGMTATVDFYVDFRENVLLLPNSALRFQPTDEMTAEFTKNREKELANLPDSIKQRMQGEGGRRQFGGGMMGGDNNHGRRKGMNRVWYFDENNKLKMSMISTGLTDGKNTEIVRGRNLKEGMKIISAILENNVVPAATTTNPFSPTPQGGSREMRRAF